MLHHLSLIITFSRSGLWLQLATELLGEEGEQFLRAYSAGLQVCLQSISCQDHLGFTYTDQEWVEALSFYHFLATGTVVNYDQVIQSYVDKI